MASIKTAIFSAGVFLIILISQIETRPSQELEERYFAHFDVTNKFNCKPRPHSVAVSDLVDVQSDEFYSPRMTVLHRCDRTAGCCKNEGETCRMKTSEEVHLVFYVAKVHEKVGKGKNRRNPFRTVTATNHTECACGNGSESAIR